MATPRGKRKRADDGRSVLREAGSTQQAGQAGPAALVPELVQRAVTLGLSGLFATNEAVRRALGEAVPREWIDFAVDQSEKTRAEFIERLAGEMARTIESLELVEMAERLLEGRTVEIRAQIQLLPREGKVKTKRLDLGLSTPGKKR